MDPMQWSPPDSLRTDRVDYYHPGVQPSPHFSFMGPAGRSASLEQPVISRAVFHQSVSNLVNPPHPELLSAVYPSPLNLRSPAPTMVLAEPTPILWSPYAAQDYHQPNMRFLPPSPCLIPNIGPCVLIPFSSPVQFWCDPYSRPGPLFISPEYHPSRYLCPQHVPVQQNFSPVLVSSTTNTNIINITEPLSVMNPSAAEIRDEQHEVVQPQNTEAGGRHTEQDEQKLRVSAEASKKTVVRQEACEDCMKTLRSLCLKTRENEDEDELETELTGNGSFPDYVDDLCNNKNFVRNVESILNTDYLNSLLSSDPEPFHLSDLENHHQKEDSSSSHTDERPWCLNSDPNLNQTREDSPDVGCSPLLPSHILEEQADDLMNIMSPDSDEICNTVCPYCSVLLDHMTLSDKEPEQDSPSDVPLDLTTAKGDRQQQCEVRFNKRAEKSRKRQTFANGEESPFKFLQEADCMESETNPKISIVLRRCPRLPGQSEKAERYVVGRPEERNQTEDSMWKMDEFTPKRDLRNYKPPRRLFSGRKLVFENEESDCKEKTNMAERAEMAESKKLNLERTKVQGGKPLNFSKEMSAILFKTQDECQEEESQTPKVVKSRVKSSSTEEKVHPTKARGKNSKRDLGTASEPQSLLDASPMKRRKTKGGSSEKVKVPKKSTIAQIRSSGNTSSLTQSKHNQRVKGCQKASGNSPVEKRCMPKCPSKRLKSTCVKTSESFPECFVSCTKWSQETWQQTMETKPKCQKSKGSKPKINRPAIKRKQSSEQATQTGQVCFEGPTKKWTRRATKTEKGQNKTKPAKLKMETGDIHKSSSAKRCRDEKQKTNKSTKKKK